MEYIEDHGTYTDIPVDVIVAAWRRAYGDGRVDRWIKAFEGTGGESGRRFDHEEVIGD